MKNNFLDISDSDLKEYNKELDNEDTFIQRWCDKFHNLTKDERCEIIKKLVKKYDSDAYYWREISLGYQPRKDLLYVVFAYGKRYGVPSYENLNGYFPEEAVIIDNHISVHVLYGQGCEIFVNFL